MIKKIVLLVSIVLFVNITEIKCRDNPGRKLNCWPFKLKYKTFAVNFTLSTRSRTDQALLPGLAFSPKEIDFDPTRKTVITVHGLATSNEHREEMRQLRDALLNLSNVNVLNVNWEKGCSNFLEYFQAVVNTEYTAFVIKDFINETIKIWREENNYGDDWTPELHFVGFSLGAHVCGQAAELLRVEDDFLVDRVTGLDPAGPCFESANLTLRLAATNALFVDVIHTDGALTEDESFGLYDPVGDVDFYINSGRKQPGCKSIIRTKRSVASLLKLLLHAIENGVCNHQRAMLVFTESIKQEVLNVCKFYAYRWAFDTAFNSSIERTDESLVKMGIYANSYNYTQSIYYVPTTDKPPYCDLN